MQVLSIPSPESFLSDRGVFLEERPPSRTGRADARTYHPPAGKTGEIRVVVSKSLSAERRRWCLWHEAAHTRDCMTRRHNGEWVGHPCLFGYGRLSLAMAQDLRKHQTFLCSLRTETRFYEYAGRSYTYEEAVADAALPAHIRSRVIRRHIEAGARRARYESSAVELFAEAIACAICDAARFDAGAPGLRDALWRAAGSEGFPV